MWKWGSGDDSVSKSGVHGTSQAANMSAADLAEQLSQTKQLVTQLKELVKEKENELHNKEQQLKEEKEASEAKISKLKLQNKAKVTSLTSQLEELKKQLPRDGTKGKSEQKKGSRDGDQDNAAASRGKILIAELNAAHQRGAEMDAMLAEKQKKLDEKEAYIIDLQLACGSTNDAKDVLIHNSELKSQLSTKEASLQSMQSLVQNLTKKVENSEEQCSLLREDIENLRNLQAKEKERFQEREAMYTQNILLFQNIIQEKEKEQMELAQKHEQELFKMAAKSDASADLEQLLKALKQKLHEKEEVMLGRTQVIDMLQRELDAKDQELKEMNEHLNRLQSEKDNLQSKLDAEKHVMRAQLRDMMEKHEKEMQEIKEKYNVDIQAIQEKHETELQEKDQALHQLQKQLDKLHSIEPNNLEQALDIDTVIKLKLEQLEAQVKLKTEEASKSEARFLKTKAWSKSRIKQLEDELKNMKSKSNSVTALHNQISELEQEKEDLQSRLQTFSELKTQNEELLAKLEVYEEQQRKLQADLEQVTKRAASQPSESGSMDELQSQLLEWQEIVTESEEAHSQIREEKSAMALRMAQIEEEREAIVSGQQELEEELATGQGIGRMEPERRKRAQSSRKLQEDYGFNGKQCFEEMNATLDGSGSTEGENMGGLRTVVEELELERNQLQEQILFLEERCRDLEDRVQLQGRMETLQNENDRLQSQITQLRNQQARDSEKHQALVSSLNEQLKGLNERNCLLETLLGEKEQKISSATEKLEQIEDMRNLLQEKDLLNKELGEKLLQTEQKLEDALKKCSSYAAECAEQKATICDLTEKISVLKEKIVKQDAAMELMRLDLEQSNEELDRLNTSHLEERSQLIQDLQRREREIDNLKEVLAEKDKEISVLSCSMTEYSEQINILKHQVKVKEGEIREMEEALTKAERKVQLLKDVQTADVKDASAKLSGLSEQLSIVEADLAKEKVECEVKTKENEELVQQIKESSKTIKDLNSEIKTRNVSYNNKLIECESQIKLLKEQMSKSAEKLQETEQRFRQETEHLRSQLDEHISAKEKLHVLLKETENKEQRFVNELKTVKDLYNQQTLENAKKDDELSSLSRQLAEHTEHIEIAKKSLQEKTEIIVSLKDKLKIVEQQHEKEKLKLVGEVEQTEMQWKEVKNDLHEKCEVINKMETERQTHILTIKQLQATLEQKEKDFTGQLKANKDLKNEVHTMEKEKQQLISENESLSKLLDVKECELLKRAQSMAETESKMCAKAIEHEKIVSEVCREKEVLKNEIEELSNLLKQRENSVAGQLLEKEKECGMLADELSKNREVTEKLHDEIQSLNTQLQDAQDKIVVLNQKETEYKDIVQQLNQGEEKILSLEKQIQNLKMDLEVKSNLLAEINRHNDALLNQVEAKQINLTELEREVGKLQSDGLCLSQQVAKKDSLLLSQGQELEHLQGQVARKTEEGTALSDQLAMLVKEVGVLKCEKDSVLAVCNAKSKELDALQHQLMLQQSEIVSTKHEVHMLKLENEKLKTDIAMASDGMRKKCEGIALLNAAFSQQGHDMLAFTDQIDTLVSEIETLKGSLHDKETLLSQKEVVIQQIKDNKDAGEKHYLQTISDLQSQVQSLSSEIDHLKQEVQGKANELKKQTQDLKVFKDKSEESDLLRVQLSENMETISDLQCQIKNMTERTEELRQSITEKDRFLKQKEEECTELQACISASSGVQQKHVESLISESEKLKAVVIEKESLLNQTALLNSTLKAELQGKEKECETLKKQDADLEGTNLCLKKQMQDQKKIIDDISERMAEKDGSLLKNASLVEKLKEEIKINEEEISTLHDKINEMRQEIQMSKELVQEKENAFLSLQDKFAAQYEERSELSSTLSKKEDFITELLHSLDQKDVCVQLAESNVQALTNETELLREELEKNAAMLKKVLQEKDESLAVSQNKFDTLTVEVESAKLEYQKTLEQAELWQQKFQQTERELQVVQEKCTEQVKQIEILMSELSIVNMKSCQECPRHILLVEKLQQQVESLIKDKTVLRGNLDELSVENKELIKNQNHLQQTIKELQELHKKLESSESDSRTQLLALTLQLEKEKEQWQTQVSVKSEEVDKLKVEIEKLEQDFCEAENRRVTDLGRLTQQNEQLSSLERELKTKEVGIQSLQQEQDMVKKELSRHLKALSGSKYFLKAGDRSAVQKATENMSVLEELSAAIDSILSKETEVMTLQESLSEKEKEIHNVNNELDIMRSLREEKELMQDDFEKMKDSHKSELEYLSNELMTAKEALYKQQCICEERDIALTDMKKHAAVLQEKTDTLEKEFENNCQLLETKCQEVAKYLEELEEKNQVIENLISQTNQQKDLIATLSQQLKEKDCSVTQVMESMSNEMVKFAEEKNALISSLQQLESVRNSMAEESSMLSQQVEECKKALEFSQNTLSNKEATIQDLLNENAQLNITLEKLSQEKENLKRKLQAALIMRKDLMQKIAKLEQNGQEYGERECKKTQDLLEQIDELTKLVKNAEAWNKNLESQLDGLKEQMVEKDAKIKDMSEMLSAEATHVDQLQRDVAEFKDTIAIQKSVVDKNLICLQEKDSLLEQIQSVLTEKDKTYGEERSQLFLIIENLKTELATKEEILKEINTSGGPLNTDSCSADLNSEIHQLKKEKEILQKKLQALLVARKESTKKIQKQKEEYAALLANLDEQTKDFELIQKEHKTLKEIHQRKCEEFDSNLLVLCSLQKQLENSASLHHSDNRVESELKVKSHIIAQESENVTSRIVASEAEMAKYENNNDRFMEEKEKFMDELREKSLQLDRKEQEVIKLKSAIEQVERQYKEDKDNMLIERCQLQHQLETYRNELIGVKALIESLNNEKDTLHKQSGDQLSSREEIEKLKYDIQTANTQISEKDKEIRYLHHSLEDLKDKFDHRKEIMKEVFQLQQSLQESQEEAKSFKTVFEKMREERDEFTNNLEKSSIELANMKEELRRAGEENKELLIELNVLREKVLPVSNVGRNVVVSENNTESICLPASNVLQNQIEEIGNSTKLLDANHIEKESLNATHTEKVLMAGTDQTAAEKMQRETGKRENQEEKKLDADEKTQERLQRKLQAALISRKEVMKENKILKEKNELLVLENKDLIDKAQALELLMTELSSTKQDPLAVENARLVTENENLTAACESLKSTMETIAQEKEAFSFQLNSLKDSQTVELTGWKAKHNELKQEYESLLQAYENISSKIAEMRHVIDVTRKEKQEALQRVKERESDNQELEKLLQKATDENIQLKEQLKQLVQSKQKEISELHIEVEKQASEHKLCLEEYQKNIDEFLLQNKQLIEENKQLKEISETLKQSIEKTENENEAISKDFTIAKSALRDLLTRLELGNLDVESKTSESHNDRESLLKHISLLNEGVSIKEESLLILKQKNKIMSERLNAAEESLHHKEHSLVKLENDCKFLNQEIASLCERIKILEDDKGLLQEELENVQETSYKVKNEKELLETELLSHIQKLDQTTDRLNTKQAQINLLTQQLEDLKTEKSNTIREKEEQQLHLVRVFEEKVKSAQRDTSGTKNRTKELQELLKEKQQEINQLQNDSIRYQEMIWDLEKSLKLSQSRSEKFESGLREVEEKLSKSNEEMQKVTEKLSLQKTLLDESKAETEQLANENLNSKNELKKKESQLLNQKREYEGQLELALRQQKAAFQKEWLSLEENYRALQREEGGILDEHRQLQEEIAFKNTQNKNLQTELNDALARLAAFAKCMSSLQNDRDRVIDEMKIWEMEFKKTIENKQQQIEGSDKTIASLQEEIKAQMSYIQELELKRSRLGEPEESVESSVNLDHFNELSRIKAENAALQNSQQELVSALKSKEDSLQALIKEKESLNHLIKNNPIEKEIEMLRKNLMRKEQEVQQLLLEKTEAQGELEKQAALSFHLKTMLNKKDTEISLLISSKDTEISGYLNQMQTQHRKQISEYEQRIKTLEVSREQSEETCQRVKNEVKTLQTKADRAVQDRAEMASEIDSFKKAMSSLQNDRDCLISKHKNLECEHRAVVHEKERLLAVSDNKTKP
ncbi:hypothetical protein JRQ81_000550 [Phrynocephalus forsythii]|uniref:Golgin subfamily B member 1-like n=1 Tax=Phrynocephalus forsythii TaxID=171643 RepID=A0A9Q0Y5H0_9SAUR|nr:hypothetical protein JRQ81_000550 [Phrynocephalus forsythii]